MTLSPLVVAVSRYYGHEACKRKIINGLRIVNNRKLAKRCDVDRAEMAKLWLYAGICQYAGANLGGCQQVIGTQRRYARMSEVLLRNEGNLKR